MTLFQRRHVLRTMAAVSALLAAGVAPGALAEERTSVKIGYAISKTGPNAGGAGITTLPNYQLWIKDVKDAVCDPDSLPIAACM